MQISASIRRTALLAAPILLISGFWIGGGSRSGAGAALGVALVVLFFAGGRAPMLLANSTPAGQLFLLVALGYVLRILLLLATIRGLADAAWLDHDAVAATVIAGSLGWTAYLAAHHLNSRQPTLEIAAGVPARDQS
jgi:hypothetical protein